MVVENASVAMVSPQGTLAEGYERTITVNVISTFLMALLLLPTLKKSASRFNIQPRLTIVSSDAHFMVSRDPCAAALQHSLGYKKSPVDRLLTIVHRQALKKRHRHRYSTPSSLALFLQTGTKLPNCFRFSPSVSLPNPCPLQAVAAKTA